MSKERLFSFIVANYKFETVSFKGTQAISELYRYEIELRSRDENIDFDEMLNAEVCLILHNKDLDDTYIHGVLEHFEAYQKIDEYIYYRASLVPKLWWLSIAHHQQIFLDKKVPDILEKVLKESRFTSNDYEFRLQSNYDKREFVCQYKESRYDFMKRWMQREGLYFYFEQNRDGCKLIISDAKEKQQKASIMKKLFYRPTTGLQSYTDQTVSSVIHRSNNTIKSVHMKNFNYEKPSLDINSVKNSKGDDYTQTYMFGHNILTQDEAKKLTKINEEKFTCQAKEMLGESNIISLIPGFIYVLKDYFVDELNDEYLMLRVDSEGSQRGFLTTGFTNDGNDASYYHNTFTMISAQTQFRDQSTVQWPHIAGMLSAVIDGQGSGDTAELDKYGRYKVIMPFDISGKKDAKASAYLRMAQPSAGEKQGIHFPLHKGTEVLISFKGGDPDQPIIMGAVPNINNPSPVNEENVTKSVIQTHGGNIIYMEDTPGKAHIKLAVHDDLSSITIHNHDEDEEEWGISAITKGGFKLASAEAEMTILGEKFEMIVGLVQDIQLAEVLEVFVGTKQEIGASRLWELIGGKTTGVAPTSEHLKETMVDVVVDRTTAVEIDDSVVEDRTEVVESKVEITQEMIQEAVEKIVSGMNLTEAIDKKIETIQDKIKTNASAISVVEEDIEDIEDSIRMIDASFEKVESMFGQIGSVIEKIGSSSKKFDFNATVSSLKIDGNDLTIFE